MSREKSEKTAFTETSQPLGSVTFAEGTTFDRERTGRFVTDILVCHICTGKRVGVGVCVFSVMTARSQQSDTSAFDFCMSFCFQ